MTPAGLALTPPLGLAGQRWFDRCCHPGHASTSPPTRSAGGCGTDTVSMATSCQLILRRDVMESAMTSPGPARRLYLLSVRHRKREGYRRTNCAPRRRFGRAFEAAPATTYGESQKSGPTGTSAASPTCSSESGRADDVTLFRLVLKPCNGNGLAGSGGGCSDTDPAANVSTGGVTATSRNWPDPVRTVSAGWWLAAGS